MTTLAVWHRTCAPQVTFNPDSAVSNRENEAALQFRRAWVSRACVEEVCRSVGTRRNVDESLLHKHTPAAALLNGIIVAPDDGRNHEMRVHPKQHPGESLCGVSNSESSATIEGNRE